MRWLCWCSAAVLLAGCGGGAVKQPHDPFSYAHEPLNVENDAIYATASFAAIHGFSFAGVEGTPVLAFLVVPRAPGRHPGVLLLHGSGGTRGDLLGQAGVLARHGIVALTITYPSDAQSYRPLIVDARRALDLLAAQTDVDRSKLGIVGFSLGAQIAAIVAGDDHRAKAVDIIGGRGTDVARYWLPHAEAHLFFQAGLHDEVVPHDQLLALMRAAPGRPRIRWYPVGHLLSKGIDDDMVAWMTSQLG